jgi:thiosulfate dehydrogenase [quinone] large subunit
MNETTFVPPTLPTTEQRQAYLLLRLVTGLDFFMHGFARIFTGSGLPGFANGMVTSMASTPLLPQAVLAAGYTIPCIELLVGTLLLLGLFTRAALTLALLLMLLLMFGITLKQDWNTAGGQLLYALVLAALLFARQPPFPKHGSKPSWLGIRSALTRWTTSTPCSPTSASSTATVSSLTTPP